MYKTHYFHLYPESCYRAGNSALLKSETGTRKGTIVCRECKGELYARNVTFALVEWRGDGRYSLEDALETFTSEAKADTRASDLYAADNTSNIVVRRFSEGA